MSSRDSLIQDWIDREPLCCRARAVLEETRRQLPSGVDHPSSLRTGDWALVIGANNRTRTNASAGVGRWDGVDRCSARRATAKNLSVSDSSLRHCDDALLRDSLPDVARTNEPRSAAAAMHDLGSFFVGLSPGEGQNRAGHDPAPSAHEGAPGGVPEVRHNAARLIVCRGHTSVCCRGWPVSRATHSECGDKNETRDAALPHDPLFRHIQDERSGIPNTLFPACGRARCAHFRPPGRTQPAMAGKAREIR
jgi:hypothetical protein